MTRFPTRLSAALLGLALATAQPAAAQMAPAHETSAEVALGDLTLTHGYAFAPLPNSPVASGFLTVGNNGAGNDRLLAARSESAAMMQIHEMAMQGDIMKMRELDGGLPIPAGETVVLQPGGLHLMFMDLQAPLVAGDTVEVMLTFERAGEVAVSLPIVTRPARGGMQHGMSDG